MGEKFSNHNPLYSLIEVYCGWLMEWTLHEIILRTYLKEQAHVNTYIGTGLNKQAL